MTKEVNHEIDTTRFVNIFDEPHDIYINKKLVFHLEPGEEKTMVVYVAQIGAKHLVDRVLQEKHGVRDTNSDTPLRRDTFAKILPDLAEVLEVKPLTPEQREEEIRKELARQAAEIAAMKEAGEQDTEKDKKIKELEEKVNALLAKTGETPVAKPRIGRPPKQRS